MSGVLGDNSAPLPTSDERCPTHGAELSRGVKGGTPLQVPKLARILVKLAIPKYFWYDECDKKGKEVGVWHTWRSIPEGQSDT